MKKYSRKNNSNKIDSDMEKSVELSHENAYQAEETAQVEDATLVEGEAQVEGEELSDNLTDAPLELNSSSDIDNTLAVSIKEAKENALNVDTVEDDDENIVNLEEFLKPFNKTGDEEENAQDATADEEIEAEEQVENPNDTSRKKKFEIPLEEEIAFMNETDAIWSDKGPKIQHTISIIVVMLIFAFAIWASWATVDEITRGQGQVIASSRTQVISHLEGGILTDILVNEGVIVEQGQVLARVENVATESVFRDTQTKIWEHTAAILRLEAELNDTQLAFPEYLRQFAPKIVAREQQVYLSRQQQYLSEISVLQSQLQQTQYELDDLSRRLDTTNEAISVAERRLELARPMLEQELYAELDFLNLQTESIRLQGEANSLRSNIAKIATALQEAKLRQELFQSEYQTKIVEEINDRLSEQASLEQSLNTGSDRVSRTEIRSPMRGIVNRIVLNTKGSAVQPGEPIMEVVPIDDTLLIEAKIRPADIGFIYPNQEAVIKLTAYDYSIYGGLDAYVELISADTISENNEYFYLVRLRTINSDFVYNGEILPIIPGMVASVDIITGQKTIMQYLLKPILKAKDNALRER